MKFTSRKDILFLALSISTIGFFIGFVIFRVLSVGVTNYSPSWNDLLMLAAAGLLLWLGTGTKYELTETVLKYQSGPIRGTIEIDKIHEIVVGKTMWSGLKPATARNGLIVKYEKYNEIYISPKTNESFVKKILELNSTIKISRQ